VESSQDTGNAGKPTAHLYHHRSSIFNSFGGGSHIYSSLWGERVMGDGVFLSINSTQSTNGKSSSGGGGQYFLYEAHQLLYIFNGE